jgi:hypothetical protein
MRILFLDDDGLSRAVPYVRQLGHEPVVLRTGVYDHWHADETTGLDVEVHHLPSDSSAQQLIDAACALAPDALISLALLDPFCHRDAVVADFFRADRGLPVVANRVADILLANDKWRTKELLRAHGIAVTAAARVESRGEAEAAAEHAGYPVLVKRNDGYSGTGMRLFHDADQLRHYFRLDHGPLLLEPFLDGIELSVDVLCWGGQCRPLAVVYKGSTDRDLRRHPIYRLRLAPYLLPPPLLRRVLAIAARAVELLGLVGIAECELILHPERGPLVLEINPRLAGTTPLSAAASGIDPHLQLVDMALSRCDLKRLSGHPQVAVQVPICSPFTPGLRARLGGWPQVRQVKEINWVRGLGITGSLTVAAGDAVELHDFLTMAAAFVDLAASPGELAELLAVPVLAELPA